MRGASCRCRGLEADCANSCADLRRTWTTKVSKRSWSRHPPAGGETVPASRPSRTDRQATAGARAVGPLSAWLRTSRWRSTSPALAGASIVIGLAASLARDADGRGAWRRAKHGDPRLREGAGRVTCGVRERLARKTFSRWLRLARSMDTGPLMRDAFNYLAQLGPCRGAKKPNWEAGLASRMARLCTAIP